MDVEQPALGTVGVDSFSLTCDWHWEGGWTLVVSVRRSGSQAWTQTRYEALSEDELHQVVEDVVVDLLRLA